MRTLARLFLSFSIVAGSASLGHAEVFEGTMESQIIVPSQVNLRAKTFLKGHMVRSEIPMQVFNSTTTAYIITDMDKRQQINIWPDRKLAVVEPWRPNSLKGMPIPDFVKTGNKDTILGYPVEQFVIRAPDGQLMEAWATTQLDIALPMRQMYSMGLPQGEGWEDIEYFKKGYVSLRTVHKAANGTVKFQFEVKKVERKALASDLFTVPPDYQRTDQSSSGPGSR